MAYARIKIVTWLTRATRLLEGHSPGHTAGKPPPRPSTKRRLGWMFCKTCTWGGRRVGKLPRLIYQGSNPILYSSNREGRWRSAVAKTAPLSPEKERERLIEIGSTPTAPAKGSPPEL